ncbi:MAG: hypothetical protein ACXAE3_15040 [Candidatus Kariarchaeaceae archaeon]|jgi:tetratricopeptide (TPR) repeat protein
MSAESEYEVKFHLYDGNETSLKRYQQEYEANRQGYREEGSVMSKVLSYFFEALIVLIKADELFWANNYREAYQNYVEAEKMFTRFSNSRNVEVRLDKLVDRYLHRVNGLRNLTEGLQLNDPKVRLDRFSEALNAFNKEVSIANEMHETMSSYAAFSRASIAEALYLLHSSNSISESDSGTAKTYLMQARGAVRQAAFIDPRYMDFLYGIEDNLDDLTKNRILVKAESFGDMATIKSENGDYLDAIEDFRKASMFYKRASTLAGDTSTRRFLLSSATVYEASELEAEGNHLFRGQNNTAAASEKFEDAAKQVDKAIALMGRFGSGELEANFASQRDYYRAMGIQSKAINLLDQEQYIEAKEFFQQSLQLFQSALDNAKVGDNPAIINLAEEAKGDIKGYISMCDTLI